MLSSAHRKSLGHISWLMRSHLNLNKVNVIVSDRKPLNRIWKLAWWKGQKPVEGGDLVWPAKQRITVSHSHCKLWNTCPAGGSFNSQMKYVASIWFSTLLKLDPLSLIKYSRDKTKLACWEKCKKKKLSSYSLRCELKFTCIREA